MEYMVRRTTYDKLQLHMNTFAAEGYTVDVQYVGGRDWVLVCSRAVNQ